MSKGNLVAKLALLVLISPLLVSCTTTTVLYDGPCPARYQPILVPEDLQIRTPEDVLEIVATNQRGFKQNIKDLEVVSGCQR